MSKVPQIHMFFGAPILPASLKKSEEETFSTAAAETWRKLIFSLPKGTSNFCCRKSRCLAHAEHQTSNSAMLTSQSEDHSIAKFAEKCGLADAFVAECAADSRDIQSFKKETIETSEHADNTFFTHCDKSTQNYMSHLVYQPLPCDVKTGEQQNKESEDEGGASFMIHNQLDTSSLVSSTKEISRNVTSMAQDNKPSDFEPDHHQLVSQYLEFFCPTIIKASKTKKPLDGYSSHDVSTDTEFLSTLTFSQVALLSGRYAVGQNEIQGKPSKLKGNELKEPCRENEVATDPFIQLNENGGTFAEINCRQNYDNSPELFDSDSTLKDSSSLRGASFQENANLPAGVFHALDAKFNNELSFTEPCKKEIPCSQGVHSAESFQASKNNLPLTNFIAENQQQSKKAKLICSPVCPIPQIKKLRISGAKKVLKHLSLLKDCLCKDQKYTILVTVLHPCHIKEIQIKPGTKWSSNVPIATVVVFDQSEIQRKVVLWRKAAFWSLTVFPGDIVLFKDVIIYENIWVGEMMLQSTFTTQLMNLGSCSTINLNELDVTILQDLLAYVSSKHAYLQAIPQRQTQTLNNIQHVLLDKLKPDTLVHSIVKIVSIAVLTESAYNFKGESERKIILTVEQVKDQHCNLVLWGALTAHYPQLQRKRDHLWEFKYLFSKHNPVSGELELHTTPWSVLECLFDDDIRAVEFRKMFEIDIKPLMNVTVLAAHLEKKSSGIIRVKACISQMKFTVPSSPYEVVFDANTSLQQIFSSLALITYVGCAKCGLELQTDDNKIFKQCISCLPFNQVEVFYRPALMNVEDEGYEISIRVVSELMKKMFLNIPAAWLNKAVEPSLDTTYGMIVADLCRSLLTGTRASYLLTIRSHFILDENSYPLEKEFSLLGFHLNL
ncbi:shieldin complex subunit 2 isoform X2 [Varanus komodoensis]|uniref:shieldin complex subunit 2 isoform X2 n=1 Tax=Varanus komodoensis TaxID=61221 RepID=UPI001CF7B9A7|nr:shieldin complex subunit 2 isoform X2 [Varanus komodoensis]